MQEGCRAAQHLTINSHLLQVTQQPAAAQGLPQPSVMSASRVQVEPQADLAETELEPVASELDAAGESLDQVWLRHFLCILSRPYERQANQDC